MKSTRIKLFYDELPTLENLKHRRPDLYPADLRCVCCHHTHSHSNHNETLHHLWTCPSRLTTTLEIIKSCRVNSIKDKVSDANISDITSDHAWNMNLFNDHVGGLLLVRGFVPTSLETKVNAIIRNQEVTILLINKMMDKLFNLFYSLIWTPRNQMVIDYENSIGITPIMKKSGVLGPHTPYTVEPLGLPSHTTIYELKSYERWVDKAINFGNNWLDFVLFLNEFY